MKEQIRIFCNKLVPCWRFRVSSESCTSGERGNLCSARLWNLSRCCAQTSTAHQSQARGLSCSPSATPCEEKATEKEGHGMTGRQEDIDNPACSWRCSAKVARSASSTSRECKQPQNAVNFTVLRPRAPFCGSPRHFYTACPRSDAGQLYGQNCSCKNRKEPNLSQVFCQLLKPDY